MDTKAWGRGYHLMYACVCFFLFFDLYLIAISSFSVTTTTSSFYPLPPPLPPPLPLSLPPPIHCQVFTWGCNDEGALGRDGDEYTPLPVVKLKGHVSRQVSAGDSHTAALTTCSSLVVCTSGVCPG